MSIPWGALLIALLQLTNYIMSYVREKQLLQAGADQEIAKQSIALLRKTEASKKINDHLSKLSRSDLDNLLTDLGNTDGNG